MYPNKFSYIVLIVLSLFLSPFAGYAQTTLIPDANFEQALIDQGIDSESILNGQVLTADIAGVTTLSVNSLNISDLTGIEDFTALTLLLASDNQLTSLDLSNNTALQIVNFGNNQLTSLDVSTNTSLIALTADNNQLTSLDVSANTSLELLNVAVNQLTSLDVSANLALAQLFLSFNQLTSLDVSTNTSLIGLTVDNNQLTSLDVSNNMVLTNLNANNNQLVVLNIQNGNNANLASFSSLNNPNLSCVQVDDVAFAQTNFTNIYQQTSFSTDCSTLSIDNFELTKVIVYPNPASDILSIGLPSNIVLERINVYNSIGHNVGSIQRTSIDVSDLSAGVYFLEIITDRGRTTRRFIKE